MTEQSPIPAPSVPSSSEGKTPELSLIEKAQQLKDQIEAQNKRQEELIRRNEEVLAKQMLGGRSGFSAAPQKTAEDIESEQLANAFSNGLNPFRGAGAKALKMKVSEGSDGGYVLQ